MFTGPWPPLRRATSEKSLSVLQVFLMFLLLGGHLTLLLPPPPYTLPSSYQGYELLPSMFLCCPWHNFQELLPSNFCDYDSHSWTEEGLTFSHHWAPSKWQMGADHPCSALFSKAFPQELCCQASRNKSILGVPGRNYWHFLIIVSLKWSRGTNTECSSYHQTKCV